MAERNPLALHDIHTHRCRIQQQVHHVVIQKVYLIHIQDTPVGGRKHTRLETSLTLLDGALYVQGSHDAIFGRTHRQIDKAGSPSGNRQLGVSFRPLTAVGAPRRGPARVAPEGTVSDDGDFGQKRSQGASRGAFRRATFSTDQNSANAWIDGV